ncbi:BnaA10g08310D [Brassica napus]|uniref:(rape) hypothetical protein n=1 Tax=Brassica napus TaxID=3708 RepID=A0A078HVC8_BRANA|nr:unnamed protein product [Brassica napus]CDY42455.1 BnaA10g08310D [Brassica napus]
MFRFPTFFFNSYQPYRKSDPYFGSITCGPSFNPALRVSDLIDPVSRNWKRDLLLKLVIPADIPLITSLRPSRSPPLNNYCWNHTKSGAYSVKSGYALAMEEIETLEADQRTYHALRAYSRAPQFTAT